MDFLITTVYNPYSIDSDSLLQFPGVLHIISVLHDSMEGFQALFCSHSKILTCRLSQRPLFDFKVKFRLHRRGAAAGLHRLCAAKRSLREHDP